MYTNRPSLIEWLKGSTAIPFEMGVSVGGVGGWGVEQEAVVPACACAVQILRPLGVISSLFF